LSANRREQRVGVVPPNFAHLSDAGSEQRLTVELDVRIDAVLPIAETSLTLLAVGTELGICTGGVVEVLVARAGYGSYCWS
jgi:hypothetical protein